MGTEKAHLVVARSLLARSLVALVLLVPVAVSAQPRPGPLQLLPAAKLRELAPTLRTMDLALIEANEKGALKQITTMCYVAAPPQVVHDVVAQPEKYRDFVRNMKESTVRQLDGGDKWHQYTVSYAIYTVDGRHQYKFPPADPDVGAVPPIVMFDPDQNGVRHYRWEFHPASGGGTVMALYGFTVIPRDGFIDKLLRAAPTLEFGLALIPQMTLMLSTKARSEQLGPKPAAPEGPQGGYAFMLDRGTLAMFRSAGGRISDISLVDRTAARPEVLVKVAGAPTQWSQFVPTIARSTPLPGKDGISGVEIEQSLPLVSWTTGYAYRADPTSADLFGVSGDLRGARMRWDVTPSGPGTSELVMRMIMPYDKGSMVVRQLYKIEPHFEYGINVGLGLVLLRGVRERAEGLTRSRATR